MQLKKIWYISTAVKKLEYMNYSQSNRSLTMPPKAKLNVHNFPRPPLLERTPRHLVVKWNNKVIADTTEGYWALETTHPPSAHPGIWKTT